MATKMASKIKNIFYNSSRCFRTQYTATPPIIIPIKIDGSTNYLFGVPSTPRSLRSFVLNSNLSKASSK